MAFELFRLSNIGSIGKGGVCFQLFNYKIESETIDDLLQVNYFPQGTVNFFVDDVIMVLDKKKDLDYKNIEYLIIKKIGAMGIEASRLDTKELPSDMIPLEDNGFGSAGTNTKYSREDH